MISMQWSKRIPRADRPGKAALNAGVARNAATPAPIWSAQPPSIGSVKYQRRNFLWSYKGASRVAAATECKANLSNLRRA